MDIKQVTFKSLYNMNLWIEEIESKLNIKIKPINIEKISLNREIKCGERLNYNPEQFVLYYYEEYL